MIVGSFNIRYESVVDTGDRAWSVRCPIVAQTIARSGARIVGLQESGVAMGGQLGEALAAVDAATGQTWAAARADRYHAVIWDTTVYELVGGVQTFDLNVEYPRAGEQRAGTTQIFRNRTTGAVFLWANAHFQSTSDDEVGLPMRAESSQILADKIAQRVASWGDSLPVIVSGDFNDWSHASGRPFGLLPGLGFPNTRDRAAVRLNDELDSYAGWDPDMPKRRDGRWIDGILTSPEVQVARTWLVVDFVDGVGLPMREPMPSDHNMLAANVTLPGDPDTSGGGSTLPASVEGVDGPLEVFCGEIVSGRRLRSLPVTACSWSVALNEAGKIDVSIPLRGMSTVDRAELLSEIEPARCYLAVQVGRQVLEAGPIWKHEYDEATGVLRVGASGLWKAFSRRHAFKFTTPGTPLRKTVLEWSALSLGTIAKRLVQETMKHPGGQLPILLPADEVGSHQRTYPAYEIPVTGDLLRDLTQVEGGPDIEFRPELRTDGSGIYWRMRVGTTGDPWLHQAGSPWLWDLAVAQSAVVELQVSVDANNRVNRALAQGAGFDEAVKLYRSTNEAQLERGYPLLEQTYPHTTTTSTSTLRAQADAALAQGSRPVTTWSLTVPVDSAPALGQYRAGDFADIAIPDGHLYLPPGTYSSRVVAIGHDLSRRAVRVDLAPTLEAR